MDEYKKGKIVDYLTIKLIEDEQFDCHPHSRVRSAWVIAKKQFINLTEEEKLAIFKIIDEKNEDSFDL
tara:strand:+ start:1529 stop:1732 length:204 start_codon:yes stop_codon:yes gene_type:complete